MSETRSNRKEHNECKSSVIYFYDALVRSGVCCVIALSLLKVLSDTGGNDLFSGGLRAAFERHPEWGEVAALPWDEEIFGFPVADLKPGSGQRTRTV